MAVRLSALCAGSHIPPRKIPILISVRGWVGLRAIVRLEGLGQLKQIHLIGTRTRDLPAWNLVPQPTSLLCAPPEIDTQMNLSTETLRGSAYKVAQTSLKEMVSWPKSTAIRNNVKNKYMFLKNPPSYYKQISLPVLRFSLCSTKPDSTEKTSSSETNSRLYSQEIPRLSFNQKVHYRIQNSPTLISVLNQTHLVYTPGA
jgi:hypothetical protein